LFTKYFEDINKGSVRFDKLIEFVDNYIAENFLVTHLTQKYYFCVNLLTHS